MSFQTCMTWKRRKENEKKKRKENSSSKFFIISSVTLYFNSRFRHFTIDRLIKVEQYTDTGKMLVYILYFKWTMTLPISVLDMFTTLLSKLIQNLHRAYITPYKRFKMKLQSNLNCHICNTTSSGTFLHMFWECPVIISLWTHVNLVLSSLLRIDWSVNPSLCLLNDDSGLCISSMQKRMLFAGFTAVKKTIIQNWFTPHMCRKTYWIRNLLQIVTCECTTVRVGGAGPSTIDAWQCFLLDIRDCIKEWLLCSCCPSLSPSLLIGPWDVEYVSVVLFCYILDIMLCCVWKNKKNVDNKKNWYKTVKCDNRGTSWNKQIQITVHDNCADDIKKDNMVNIDRMLMILCVFVFAICEEYQRILFIVFLQQWPRLHGHQYSDYNTIKTILWLRVYHVNRDFWLP